MPEKPKMVKVRNTAKHPAQRIQPGQVGEVPEDLAALCPFFEVLEEKGGKPDDEGKGEPKGSVDSGKPKGGKPKS